MWGNKYSNIFETLTIQNEGENPYIRIVLDAKWTPSNSPEGDIDSSISFITSSDDDTKCVPMTAFSDQKLMLFTFQPLGILMNN